MRPASSLACNRHLINANLAAMDASPFPRPYVVSWNLTYRCNLACEHCYLDAGGTPLVGTENFADRSELGTEECFRIIDEIASFAPECLTILTGGEPLVRADLSEVRNLEAQLWISFPDGYTEYVTMLGEGVLGGTFVRIYPPWRIARELEAWRSRIRKYWFWDAGREVLPKERAVECVIIGDTWDGDELVFHPW
jgi:hypothetical protein